MNKIVISGYYGFGNAGDEAMLDAILEALFNLLPESEITVISGNITMTKEKHGVNAIDRFSFRDIYQTLKEADLLISGGGSLLQDVTSDRSLYYYLSIISMAKFLNKPVMLYAQGIGPLRRRMAKISVAKVLNKVDLITVRDEGSRKALTELGVNKPEIIQTADAVLGMNPIDAKIGMRLLQEYNLSGVPTKLGVSVRSWKKDTSYRLELAKALDVLHKENQCEVVFIPMQHPDDMEEAKCISKLMKANPIVLDAAYTTPELISLVGCMDVLIGVRLHALIFATIMNRPIVGISYDPKIDHYLEMIGETAVGKLHNLTSQAIINAVRDQISEKQLKMSTVKLIEQLRINSLQNAKLAVTLLEKSQKI